MVIVDQNLSPSLVRFFNARGIEAVHVLSLGMDRSSDGAIWNYARDERAVVVTKDHDFVTRALLSGPPPQVIHLEGRNARNSTIEANIDFVWPAIQAFVAQGRTSLLSVSPPAGTLPL